MDAQIYKLISKVMAEIGGVAKTRKNQQQNYAFRGIEDMYFAVHPALVAHGVFCAPEVTERTEHRFEKTNEYGKTTTWVHVAVKVIHRFYAPDGSSIEVTTYGEGLDNSDKATNKAMSGAMKYALIELFSVPTQDVEDSDRTTPEAGIARVAAEPITLVPKAPAKTPAKKPEKISLEEAVKAFSQSANGAKDGLRHVTGNLVSRPGPSEAAGSVGSVPASAAPEPEDEPFQPQFISKEQKQYLAQRFRESLKPEHQKLAEEFRHDALFALGKLGKFKSQFIDDHGNPTSEMVLADEYDAVGKTLVKFAKSL